MFNKDKKARSRSSGGGAGFGKPATQGFGQMSFGGPRQPRMEEQVEMLTFKSGSWKQVRILPGIYSVAQHWITINTKKGEISIPKTALNYDVQTNSFDSTIEDPYVEQLKGGIRTALTHFVCVIDRDLQDNFNPKRNKATAAETKSGFKDKDSSSDTPVRVMKVTNGLGAKLQNLTQLNVHKTEKGKKAFELSDPKYGCDVFIKYDPDAKSAGDTYTPQKGDPSPLTKEEKAYLLWDIASALPKPESLEVARKEAESLLSKLVVDEDESIDDDEDDDDEDDLPVRKSKSKSKAKSKKSRYDLDDDEDDDEDDEDDLPVRKSKSKSKASAKSSSKSTSSKSKLKSSTKSKTSKVKSKKK